MEMLMAFMHCDSQDLWGSIIGAFRSTCAGFGYDL